MIEQELRTEIVQLKAQLAERDKIILDLKEKVEYLQRENKELYNEIERLHKELRKYKNENTPSGSIPPYLKKTLEKAVEQPKEKPPTNENTTNIRNARPNRVDRREKLELCKCPYCNGPLTKKKKTYSRRVIHIQIPDAEVVEYKIPEYYCSTCKKTVRPKVPDALPNSKFDLNTAILISFLVVVLNMSVSNVKTLFSTLFGLEISKSSISNILQQLRYYLGDEYAKLEAELKKAKVRYRDETGWRINGKLNWVWVCASAKAIIYKIEKSREHKIAKRMENPSGVDVCDGYAAYNKLKGERQRCWAHLLRMAKNPEYGFRDEKEVEEYARLVE